MKVKKLEWEEDKEAEYETQTAYLLGGYVKYEIVLLGYENIALYINYKVVNTFSTFDEAEKVANDHFESLIKECIEEE